MDRSGQSGDKRLTALLVDDDSSAFALHLARLHALGYHVIRATDPALALTIAEQATPRIIFVSVGQRVSGSTPFLQALRSNDSTRHIPVGILSIRQDTWLESLGLRRIGRQLW